MEEYSEHNTGFNQTWELANEQEFYARSEEGNCQVQPWCSTDSYAEMPFQQDYHHPYQPNFYPQTQPTFHSPSFQNPYHNNQPYLPESDQNFFYHPDSFPNFQTPSYGDSIPHFQNQEQLFYSQPHAFIDFQQEDQFFDYHPWSCHELQPSQMPAAAHIFSHGAGTSWRNLDAVVENNREEEEKSFILVDKAQEWKMEVEEREFDAEEEKFREENEPKGEEKEKVEGIDYHSYPMFRIGDTVISYDQYEEEEKEKMMEDYNSYPLFRIGDKLLASSTCHTLFLRSANDNHGVGGGVEQAELELPFLQPGVEAQQQEAEEKRMAAAMQYLAELDIPFPAALNRTLQQREEEVIKKKLEEEKMLSLLLTRRKEGEKEKTLEEDEYFSLLFKEGEEANAAIACGCYQKRRQKRKRKKKKKLEAVQYTLLEVNEVATIEELTCDELELLHLQSAQQQEEEVRKEKNLTAHGPPLLVKEEEAAQFIAELLNLALDIHNEQRQQQEEEENKKLDALPVLHLLKGEEEDIDALTCEDLDILVREVYHLLQHSSSSKEQGEKNQLSPYSLQLHRIKEKSVEDFTSADFDFLLLEETPIKAGQHQFKDEKRKEEEQKETRTPDLHKHEVSELHHPQATTPRHKEAAAYPSNANSFSIEFELTLNQFLLSLNVFISGDKLQTQQLNLITICKLQPKASCGDVHKKGTRGDGVFWCIKVHPP